MVTIVLLKEAWMCTTPWGTCLRSFFLNFFCLPFFSGAAPVPAAAAFAMSSLSVVRCPFFVRRSHLRKCHSYGERKPENRQLFLGLCRRFLLLRYCALARSFARASVRVRTLTTNRQVAAMPVSAIGTDFDEPLDIHRNFLAQIAFHHAFRFDDLANAVHLVFAQVLHLLHRVHIRLIQNARGARITDPIDISQPDIHALLSRKIDASNTCHVAPLILAAVCAWNSRRSLAPHLCA